MREAFKITKHEDLTTGSMHCVTTNKLNMFAASKGIKKRRAQEILKKMGGVHSRDCHFGGKRHGDGYLFVMFTDGMDGPASTNAAPAGPSAPPPRAPPLPPPPPLLMGSVDSGAADMVA